MRKCSAVAPIKTTKMATVLQVIRRNILKRITTTATMVPRRNTPGITASLRKKANGKKKANNNNNNNNNGKSSSVLLRDESSNNNSPTASSADPDTPRVKSEWEAEEEERRQREEEEEMRRHAALRMSEKRLLDAAIEREREQARLEREEKEEKARLAKEAKRAEKAAQKVLKSKSASNSPLTSPRTAMSDAPSWIRALIAASAKRTGRNNRDRVLRSHLRFLPGYHQPFRRRRNETARTTVRGNRYRRRYRNLHHR